ncbi:hypothetical protein CAPTEDRAFT_213795 [Capitella teleta]|uniref:Uncharacterized protein n=1 Tax=Capitella teleta TaxID=283909 RepID=R7UG38_CAPTE|nr:hypothetical protein CAPTEDRAFT_213795 [Capitella teleta]|eukprot:ELU02257.1 hypothetical protein CAPTEDRAFT_213795 [Capitella teleta]
MIRQPSSPAFALLPAAASSRCLCNLRREKSSLLNKLFGRNKSKRSNSMGRTSIDNGAAEERGKDYATFSAQFPPPEWLWYEEHARPKPTTWGQHTVLLGDAASESNSEAGGECPLHTLPQGIPGFMDLAEGNTYTEDPCGFFENKDLHTSMHSHESGGGPALEVEAAGQSKELVVPRKVRNRSPRKTRHKRRSKVKKMSDEEEEEEEGEEDGEHDEEAVLNNAKVMSRVDRPPTHVSRVFRKYREMKGHSFLSNDIHIEFKGQLDKKSFGKSKESGVNCVGVDALDPPPPPTANHVEHAVEVHRSENLHEDSGFNSPRTTNENLYESIASRTAECFSDSSKQTVVHEAPLRNSLSPKQVRRKKNDRLLNCVQGSNRLSKHVDKQAVQQQVSDTVSAEKKKELKVVGML